MSIMPRFKTLLFLFISFLLLVGCSDSSSLLPACCNDIDVSGFAKLTILSADTTIVAATDWRTKGMVASVKNEGACSASSAFGITSLVESYHAITTGLLFNLSEQQMVDCDADNNACSGNGDPIAMLNGMMVQNGLETEALYPYVGAQGTCKYDATKVVATIPDFGLVPPGDEDSLKAYVAKKGPVLAFIDDCHQSFVNYKSGVYYEPMCSSTRPTRAVVIVGYDVDSETGNEYWIVRASLGTTWGNNGYIYMGRNMGNNCGIASYALSSKY